MAFVLCTRWVFCAVDWFVVSGGPWLHLRSSPGGLFSVGAVCCLCFGAGVFCSSALFPGGVLVVIRLWLICCTTFPCRQCCCTVTLFSLCVVGCFCWISFLLQYLFLSALLWVALFSVLHSCVVILSVPVVCVERLFSVLSWLCIAALVGPALLEAACLFGVGVKVRLLFLIWSGVSGGGSEVGLLFFWFQYGLEDFVWVYVEFVV